jgi:hypothetical protein
MYLDVSFGWRERADQERMRTRRRRNALRLLSLLLLLIAGGLFALWRGL